MPRTIVLLTDFGLSDAYVGQMKGVIHSHAPGAAIVDLCHQVEPFNILQAGFFLAASHPHFPGGAVFVSVVDPGVGGDRRIVLLEKHGQFFLAPDNGLLTFLLQQSGPSLSRDVTPARSGDASATFHGRDIFAPLAARLAGGAPSTQIGEECELESLVRLPEAEPMPTPEGVSATVLHVDRFGNCLLNLENEAWGGRIFQCQRLAITVSGASPRSLCPAYTYERLERGQLGVIKGSQGFLELAMNRKSAAAELNLTPGGAVSVRLDRS